MVCHGVSVPPQSKITALTITRRSYPRAAGVRRSRNRTRNKSRNKPYVLLTITTYLVDYSLVSSDYVTIGTQLLGQLANGATLEPGQPWEESVPPYGPDGTLLAIVPIPGTQTSLAIVGYAVSTAAEPERPPAVPGPMWATEPARDTGLARDAEPDR